jgi:hypothetical protein
MDPFADPPLGAQRGRIVGRPNSDVAGDHRVNGENPQYVDILNTSGFLAHQRGLLQIYTSLAPLSAVNGTVQQ